MIDDLLFARALHVIAIVHWIGGVGFVTLVVLPLALSRAASDGLKMFDLVERRFASQVRISIPIAGVAGFGMTFRMNLSRVAVMHVVLLIFLSATVLGAVAGSHGFYF
jgi:uncharacterized membrane protein